MKKMELRKREKGNPVFNFGVQRTLFWSVWMCGCDLFDETARLPDL